jgi:hypothetical protein
MSHALRGEPLAAAGFWPRTRTAQRGVWACSYSRAPWRAKRRPTLFTPDDDQSFPATRTCLEAVAA